MKNDIVTEKSIGQLFFEGKNELEFDYTKKHTYNIPLYQRAYRWDKELCEILFNDIIQYNSNQYNFGFITLAKVPNKKRIFDIVDGQQRIVSIYILFLAMYKYVAELSENIIDYRKLYSFLDTSVPFSSNARTIYSLKKVYSNSKEGKEIIPDSNDNLYVLENYEHLFTLVKNHFATEIEDKTVSEIYKAFEQTISQTIFVLVYDKRLHALDSFISINMKSQGLDSFEVLSALLLNKIDSKINETYRQKIDEFYNFFTKQTSFEKFDYFLKAIIWTQYNKYIKYCKNVELIKKEVRIKMPNHYVQNNIYNSSNATTFIDTSINVTKRYIDFEATGNLNYILKLADNPELPENRLIIKRINNNIEIIKEIHKSGTPKQLNIIHRYILSLINVLEHYLSQKNFQGSNKLIEDITKEFIFLNVENHIINLIGNNRVSKEYQNITSANDLKKLYKKDTENLIDFSKIKKNKKISGYDTLLEILNPDKLYSIKILYQLISSIKEESIKGKKEIYKLSNMQENKEHLFIDKSNAKKLLSKDALGFNTFMIPEDLNTEFADMNLKCFVDKANHIIKKTKNEYRKYHWFYKLCKYGLDSLNELSPEYLEMDKKTFENIKLYYTKNINFKRKDLGQFLVFHKTFLSRINEKFMLEIEKYIYFFDYENPKVLITY